MHFLPGSPRLPFPYRPESGVVASHLEHLSSALDWAAAAQLARPWINAVRSNPPPFWAMESLLKEYPISSAEGLALMRLAEALLRVPDAQKTFEAMRSRKVLVKNVSKMHPLLANCLRLTVGTADENHQMLAALKESL